MRNHTAETESVMCSMTVKSLEWFTLRGTTKQNPDHSMDPGRWLFGEKSRVHTAAL